MTTAAPPRTAPKAPPKVDVTGYDGPTDLTEQIKLAEFLAMAEATIPPVYRNRPADLLAMLYQAHALNIPVMTALGNLHWNETIGKGAMSAQLMGALLLRGGVVWETVEISDKRVEMRFTRLDGRPAGECDWRIGEAIGAGIAGRDTWQHYPIDMLYARCLARGARRFAPDLVLGMGYTPEELHDMEAGADAPPVDDRAVPPAVTALLDQINPDSSATAIRELLDQAKSKKVNLAGEYAGDGQTLGEKLQAMWLAAVAREHEARAAAADAQAPAAGEPAAPVVPGDAAATLNAPAGEGTLPCGCSTSRVLSGQGHKTGVCTGVGVG